MASVALPLGCGGGVETAAEASSSLTCTQETANDAWSNQPFGTQTRGFSVELDATPSSGAIDAVIGVSDGAASSFAQVAAAVRFNPDGAVDARDGARYRADTVRAYQAGQTYHIILDIDLQAHVYDVWLRDSTGHQDAIAIKYAFRTEQSSVTQLGNIASKVDQTPGTLALCGAQMVVPTPLPGCVTVGVNEGFATMSMPDATAVNGLYFTVVPSANNIDLVIGLSAGNPSGFSDLATSLRFSPAGTIDVRDGSGYRADFSMPYQAGQSYSLAMIADVASHTYSAFAANQPQLAQNYAFRTEQAAVAHVDRLNAIVDNTAGGARVCEIRSLPSSGVAFARSGRFSVAPLPGDEVAISDGATTQRLDTRGRVVAAMAHGGTLAADASGNVVVANVADTTLTVDSYSASFALQSHATAPVPPGSTLFSLSVAPSGAVMAGTVSPDGVGATRFRGAGYEAQLFAPGEAIAFDGEDPVVASNQDTTLRISHFANTGATVWATEFTGHAQITAMAVDPTHGVVFGGALQDPIDFGGGPLRLFSNPEGPVNGFVARLSATGGYVFARKTGYSFVGGIAASSTLIAVSNTERTQLRYEHLLLLDSSGAPVQRPFALGLDDRGFGRSVAVSESGRVWWNIETAFPNIPTWPYVVAIAP